MWWTNNGRSISAENNNDTRNYDAVCQNEQKTGTTCDFHNIRIKIQLSCFRGQRGNLQKYMDTQRNSEKVSSEWKMLKKTSGRETLYPQLRLCSTLSPSVASTWISEVTFRSKTKLQLYWSYSNYCSYKLNRSVDAASHWKLSRLFVWKRNRKNNETVTASAVLFVRCSTEAENCCLL